MLNGKNAQKITNCSTFLCRNQIRDAVQCRFVSHKGVIQKKF